MTILTEALFSLVYYSATNRCFFGKEIEKHETFFKRNTRNSNCNGRFNGDQYILQYT